MGVLKIDKYSVNNSFYQSIYQWINILYLSPINTPVSILLSIYPLPFTNRT